jgi:UDP-GlcNAc:undecaprenyl-phosphate GlcNAc-1-phosphate transferase
VLGFSLGVLAITITQRPDGGLSPFLPLLVLGVPIFDMLTVMVSRIARGQSPFQADRTHLHHRLLDSGLTQAESVTLIYGLQFLLVVLAYILRDAADGLILGTYLAVCGMTLVGERLVEHHRGHLFDRPLQHRPLARALRWLRGTGWTSRLPYLVLSIAMPTFLVGGALLVPAVGVDIGLLAAALALTLLLALLVRRLPFFALERLGAYTAAIVIAYLFPGSPVLAACPTCIAAFYVVLAVAAAAWVRFSTSSFQVSTLDVLILLGALVAPTLRDLGLQDIGLFALKVVVLFYAIEIMMQTRERRWDFLRVAILASLCTLAVRGLLWTSA